MARGSRGSGRRTDYSWGNFGDIAASIDLGFGAASFGATRFVFNVAGTVMRVRGKVGVVLDTGGVNESAIILCGLIIVPGDMLTTPPELFTDGSDEGPWLWQGALYVSSGAEASVDGAFPGLTANVDIDSKAMRRIKPTEQLAFVHESPASITADQTGTYDLTYYVHVLVGT